MDKPTIISKLWNGKLVFSHSKWNDFIDIIVQYVYKCFVLITGP